MVIKVVTLYIFLSVCVRSMVLVRAIYASLYNYYSAEDVISILMVNYFIQVIGASIFVLSIATHSVVSYA